jgi:hypothetical protein
MRRRAPQVTLVLFWFGVPLLCGVAVSHTVVNIWQARYLLYILPAYALLIGFSVDRLAQGLLGRPALLFAAAVALASLAINARYYTETVREGWHDVIAYLRDHRRPGDGFGVYADQVGPAFGYYYERELGDGRPGGAPAAAPRENRPDATQVAAAASRAAPGTGIPGTGGEDWVPLLLQPRVFRDLKPAELRALFAQLPPKRPRYWLVLSHHEHRGGDSIQRYAQEQYHVLERREFQYIELMLFKPRA